MSIVVLDTNVVSYFMKGGPLAEAYRKRVRGKTLTISFMTVAEMYEGADRAAWGAQKLAQLEAVLRSYVVVASSHDMCRCWGRIRSQRRSRPISVDDTWIAATALACSADLVTHNPVDFEGIDGLSLVTDAV